MYVDEGIFDALLLSSNLTVEDLKGFQLKQATDTPTLKPNKNLGEGKASKAEFKYRDELIGLLTLLYPAITKTVEDSKLSTAQKIEKVNELVDSHFASGQEIVRDNTKKILDNAVTTANGNLQKLDKSIDDQIPDNHFLKAIQNQQNGNLKSIQTTLTDTINAGLNEDEINSLTREDYQSDYSYVDNAFNKAQQRLDGMGWYGWYKSNEVGLLSTYVMGSAILGNLVADWLTCEDTGDCSSDGPVCDECLDMAENGPYSVLNWPSEIHFGDRCSMGAPYLANT